ncbi:MAG: hypothetical protein LBM71_04135 [Elusimicrobiota bacterium]|jgi:hypothetical protein|nr:hypothetical protein [Elusimicrobiota bacterium]
MKRFFCLTVFMALSLFAFAENATFDNFSKNITAENLKPFTKDLGGLLGGSAFTTGRILGWGGFQLSARASLMPKPSEKNTALGQDAKAMVMPWVQGEIGLPFRIDGFIRASSWDGLTVAGGGLKWGITRPKEILYTFQPMLVVMAQSGVHKDFSLSHYSADFVLSFKLPYVVPYIGGGVDHTKVRVEGADTDASLVGKTEATTTPRATAGVNIKLPAYMDLSMAANYANYGFGAEASLGVRF